MYLESTPEDIGLWAIKGQQSYTNNKVGMLWVKYSIEVEHKPFLGLQKKKVRCNSKTTHCFSHICESWVTGSRLGIWITSSCNSLKDNHNSCKLELHKMNALKRVSGACQHKSGNIDQSLTLHSTNYHTYTPSPRVICLTDPAFISSF